MATTVWPVIAHSTVLSGQDNFFMRQCVDINFAHTLYRHFLIFAAVAVITSPIFFYPSDFLDLFTVDTL